HLHQHIQSIMATTLSRTLCRLAFGSLAIIALNAVSAQDIPTPVTVTVTETTTVWADSSWPTKAVTQIVASNSCPSEPQYSCFVVHTTTTSAHIPQGSIHMVLPQQCQAAMVEEEYESMDWATKDADQIEFAVDSIDPASVIQPLSNATPMAIMVDELAAPACVNYATTTSIGPCPTFTPLALDSNECAVITSTSLALATPTAVPEVMLGKQDNGETLIYTISGGFEEPCHQRKHHQPRPTSTADVPDALAAPSEVTPTPVSFDLSTSYKASISTHLGYTVSFDFTYSYGTAPPMEVTPFPELPALTSSSEHKPTLDSPTSPEPSDDFNVSIPPSPTPAPIHTMDFTTTVTPATEAATAAEPTTTAKTPSDIEKAEAVTTSSIPEPTAPTIENIGGGKSPVPFSSPDSPKEDGKPPAEVKKACKECTKPCRVDLNVVAKAEVPLMVELFRDKIKKALSSLTLTLETESGANSEAEEYSTGLFSSLRVNVEAAAIFRKTCEDKVEQIQRKHLETLS
ncbi:hypothetical protein BGX26_007160, partial [Mortierella sp. AD094]